MDIPTSDRSRPRGRVLGPIDWIEAGQQILIEEGITGVRLHRLMHILGVSTGSFYHHFRDMDDYLSALADHFPTGQVQALLREISDSYANPLDRMKQLAIKSLEGRLFKLDAAMRIWAASDQRAGGAIIQSEHRVVTFLRDEFVKLGFDKTDATVRARLLLSAAIVTLVSVSATEMRAFRRHALALLTAR